MICLIKNYKNRHYDYYKKSFCSPVFGYSHLCCWVVEEVERLEQELEERGAEIEQLQEEKAVALKDLEHQEKLQESLKQQSQEQQQRQEQLEMELDTKSELVCNRAVLSLIFESII